MRRTFSARGRWPPALGLTLLIYGWGLTVVRASDEDDGAARLRLLPGGLAVVSARVEGRGPFDFLLDTGTNTTLVSERLAARLALRATDRVTLLTVAGERAVPRTSLRTLELGGRAAADVEALVCELRELRALDPRVEGVIGQNVLSRFAYTLSYDGRRIEFDAEGESAPDGVRVPFVSDEGRLIVPARAAGAEGRALRLVLDAAATGLLLFGEAARALCPAGERASPARYVATEAGRTPAVPARVSALEVGAETLRDLAVGLLRETPAADGRTEDGLLPTSLFRAVYVNHRDGYVIFNPRRR